MHTLSYRFISIALIAILGVSVIIFLIPDKDTIQPEIDGPIENATEQQIINKPATTKGIQDTAIQKQQEPDKNEAIPEGVNTVFRDKPEVQVIWMERGKSVVVNNNPEADNADFRNTFFHRGAKARPVTCGEVQFLSDDSVIEDYQRFIYTGIQRSYLEHDVVNFDIFWSIMCEQTLDEYFDEEPKP